MAEPNLVRAREGFERFGRGDIEGGYEARLAEMVPDDIMAHICDPAQVVAAVEGIRLTA